MEPTAWLGLATLLLGVPISTTAALLMLKKWRKARHLTALKLALTTAIISAVLVGVFGFIFVNNDQVTPPISDVLTKYITRVMVLVMALVPAVLWIRFYWTRRDPKP